VTSRPDQLLELGRRITESLDLPTVLQRIVDGACELVGARYGILEVLSEASPVPHIVTHGISPTDEERVRSLRVDVGTVKVPIQLDDGRPAHLYVADGSEPITAEEERLLIPFAEQAALAIRNARLHSEVLSARDLLERIVADSPDAVIYADQATGRVRYNRRARSLLGRPPGASESLAEACGRCLGAGGEPLPAEQQPACRALRGEQVIGEEHLIGRTDGTVLPVLVSAAPLHDHRDRLLGAVVQFQDLTHVKEAQRRIEDLASERGRLLDLFEAQRRRLQSLIDVCPVGLVVAEPDGGRVVLTNREAQRLLGASSNDDTLRQYEQKAIPRSADGRPIPSEELPIWRALLRGEVTQAEEIHLESPDGRTIHTLVNAAPVFGSDGRVVSAVAAIQDLTPLEQVEALRSDFLAIVSHEFKTPLTAIKGAAATVLGSREAFTDAEVRELLQIIDQQADRLRDLANNLLDMTRIEAGTLSIRREPMDLRTVLDESLLVAARSGVRQEIRLEIAQDLPAINADRHRIVQVVTNLLSNAAKASPAAAPITVCVEADPHHVAVRVRDAGRGITPDRLAHLFRKFSQVHEDVGDRLTGSGLGLAISQGIVEAHGGRIWAESPGEGRGATFSFTLPVAAPSPPPEPLGQSSPAGSATRRGERARIFAVDDDPQVLRLLRRTLDEAGYDVLVTQDPAQVMPTLESRSPDLVILDLRLPGTNGFDVLRRIRESSDVPVVFLTASSRDADIVQGLKLGADDYVTKPFSPPELLARIGATLRRRLPAAAKTRPPVILGDLTVDFVNRTVTVAGRDVALSATEYKILYELASHAGRVLTYDQILQRVWGQEYAGEAELVRAHMRNLRRKLGDNAQNPRYILTVPRVGYRMPAAL
jgi:PAS domain S-box-containing protein